MLINFSVQQPFVWKCWLTETKSFLRIQETWKTVSWQNCLLNVQPGRASKPDSQSTHLGNSDFCSPWFSVRGQGEIALFPEDWQDHLLTRFAGILFGLDIKYRLNWYMLRRAYWIFKHVYLKRLCCWKSEQAQQQFTVLSFYCPNRKQRSLYKEKEKLSKSIKKRQSACLSWCCWNAYFLSTKSNNQEITRSAIMLFVPFTC